jgi:hypothetical protein
MAPINQTNDEPQFNAPPLHFASCCIIESQYIVTIYTTIPLTIKYTDNIISTDLLWLCYAITCFNLDRSSEIFKINK